MPWQGHSYRTCAGCAAPGCLRTAPAATRSLRLQLSTRLTRQVLPQKRMDAFPHQYLPEAHVSAAKAYQGRAIRTPKDTFAPRWGLSLSEHKQLSQPPTTHIMTPAANPSDEARSRGVASFTQKTMHAPRQVHRPPPMTRPKATATFPWATIAADHTAWWQ